MQKLNSLDREKHLAPKGVKCFCLWGGIGRYPRGILCANISVLYSGEETEWINLRGRESYCGMPLPAVFNRAAISMEPLMELLLRNPVAATNSDNRKFPTVNEPIGSYLPDL